MSNGDGDHGAGEPQAMARYAAYALIGAVIGAVAVFFVADTYNLQTFGAGLGGGAIAGALAGFIRTRAGLDR